ncbi:T9SS type B sorting domain-containing protein [Flavobacterium sp. 7A]|uniref:T9SS type B sorting domain-containing protein n=1 Tax=Flavobacterium sp. 7A TaxID=2940571 RepID=UPI0022265310|nr:T9SS type B sorting domain-containing protein [Flavobacterium sp. 7A]MCW2119496.1 gliding motility-associated-like protein [Flavobacterium sp. 7A]
MKNTLLTLFVFVTLNSFAQFSKTHYIPPLTSASGTTVTPEDQYLYISTPTITDVIVTITPIGGTPITKIVNNANPIVYTIGTGTNTQLCTPSTTIGKLTNKGYIVEAPDLIYTSVRTNNGDNNQSGGLVSKGNSALGKTFRIGAMLNKYNTTGLLNFASILATENDTHITITLNSTAVGTTLTDGTIYNSPISVTLNKNESYIMAIENNGTNYRSNLLIGGLITTDKNVVVNCGSIGGSNYQSTGIIGDVTTGINGRDVGYDQIVSFEKTGNEYIFIEGLGSNALERVLLIAQEDNTQISINGSASTVTINAGEYFVYDGHDFINGNLYVTSTNNVFAYQSIGGGKSAANQNLCFVPPLNCATPSIVDNIPFINKIGTTNYTGTVNIVTKTGADVSINNSAIVSSPKAINGNPNYVYYSVSGLSGNTSIQSTKEVYVSYYGTNNAATYGGYYSGFDLKPEIALNNVVSTTTGCMPNIQLKITSDPLNNTFQWVFNGVDIPGEISNTYIPSLLEKGPGYYQVKKNITSCSTTTVSDEIPVSDCPVDTDGDGVNNNIDIDNDNDGITNCTESYGDKAIDISNLSGGTIAIGNYSNSYTSSSSSVGAGTNTFTGNINGSFTTNIAAGNTNSINYQLKFNTPISLGLKYNPIATATASSLSNEEFIIKSSTNKTITILNPSNQLLIDTNYDGIYESDVTEFSSFDVRFRLNGTVLLPASGTAPAIDFKLQTNLSETISFTHINLSDTEANSASFSFYASCVPKDSDADGITDDLDLDSDNDGIPDTIEGQENTFIILFVDANHDGLNDAFGAGGLTPKDTDNDGIADFLDLDSDNDGIYDLVESGSSTPDADTNGVVDGNSFGTNGLADSLETNPDNGILKYSITDTDADGTANFRDLDSDNDLCYDVKEAGFSDPNDDGLLGSNVPPTVDNKGLVTSKTDGYTTPPNNNYKIAAPIIITNQPNAPATCELQQAIIPVVANGDSYQWQVSTNGTTWTTIANGTTYSNATTNQLKINSVTTTMNGYKYRVFIDRIGNSCGLLSSETTLTVYPIPTVNDIRIVQCDDDTDGISIFNLTVKNDAISANAVNESIRYYTSQSGADTGTTTDLIPDPIHFANTTPTPMTVWARVENSNNCFNTSQIQLDVVNAQIPSTFNRTIEICDDLLDTDGNNNSNNNDQDGIATFDFSSVENDLKIMFPETNYSVYFYKSKQDALAELNPIQNTSNYRNISSPNEQQIWIRVDSNSDNSCSGLGFITLKTNPLPVINTNLNGNEDKLICSNIPTFFIQLDAGIQDGSSTSDYFYKWFKNNTEIPTETNSTLEVNAEADYSVEVTSKITGCSRIRNIKVTPSDIATISSIEINDLIDNNSITIIAKGLGDYEYSINDEFNFFQTSNTFNNVAAGIQTVYVRDINGCGTVSQVISVLGAPKFFTPNGDGYNDYWNIQGINNDFNAKSVIYIFDRYGKLLKQLNPLDQGWDGIYNNNPLPADDYWYTVKFEDGTEAKGHFSLKR